MLELFRHLGMAKLVAVASHSDSALRNLSR